MLKGVLYFQLLTGSNHFHVMDMLAGKSPVDIEIKA